MTTNWKKEETNADKIFVPSQQNVLCPLQEMPAAAAERPAGAGAGAGARMQTTLSAWTPLNHPMSNNKVLTRFTALHTL